MWEVATQGEVARLTHVRGTFLLLPPSPMPPGVLVAGHGGVLLAEHQLVLHRTN